MKIKTKDFTNTDFTQMNKMIETLTNQQKTGHITSNSDDVGRWEEKNKYKGKG